MDQEFEAMLIRELGRAIGSETLNRCYRITLSKGQDVIVRLPILGRIALRKEKLESEISVMEYIAHSAPVPIPVPRVIGSGTCVVGPYMVIEFINGTPMVDHLHAPLPDRTKVAVLDPAIDPLRLRRAYYEMAHIVLALYQCQFSEIGCPTKDADNGTWSVHKSRPMVTYNVNEILVYANFPPHSIYKRSFSTATDYFVALAETHIQHFKTQRNNAVTDEADCRKKYIARCLFKKIASRFSTTYDQGPFPLFCDDLRPSNVIVDTANDNDSTELRIRSVIDWEFCYAAPMEFTLCAPWWLLLAHPDNWENGLDDFLDHYKPCLDVFLSVLKDCEKEEMATTNANAPTTTDYMPLSGHMEQSIHNGMFWFCLAARSSLAFDDIYWKFIDPVHYKEFDSIEDRVVSLLSKDEQVELENIFQVKMEQAAEQKLDQHWTLDEILSS